jgi:meiosis-specific protein
MQQQTINKQQSLTLTKNLLLATIGSIAYVRMLFPEDNFLTKGLDGIAVKTLKQNVSIEANTLLEWIEKGVFDAIQKQYLNQLVFGIYLDPHNPLDLTEHYQFEFSYPDKDSFGFSLQKVSMTHQGK